MRAQSLAARWGVVMLRDPGPLGGRCPACDGVFDETGCRLVGPHWTSLDPARTLGIHAVFEVDCTRRRPLDVMEAPR
jgi:hypothetical protein